MRESRSQQVEEGGRPGVMCDKRMSPRMIRRCRRERRRRRCCTALRNRQQAEPEEAEIRNVELLFGGAELVRCFGDKEMGRCGLAVQRRDGGG